MESWRSNVRQVTPYVPGEQPRESGIIKLNTNENPYGPPPGVERAIQKIDTDLLRKYPDPTAGDLVAALASYHSLEKEQVFVGLGSDDVLAMSFLTFFNGEKPILFPDITYSFYEVWASMFRIPFRQPALTEDFSINPEDYLVDNGGIIFPNPNAPTGKEMEQEEIRRILRSNPDVVVIIDEAYVDFGGESALPLLDEFENLLVVRTFSKSRAMAGMRIGYACGSRDLISYLQDAKYSFNSYTMNVTALAAGIASVEDEIYFRDRLEEVIASREWTEKELARLGFSFPTSKGNFIFASHPACQAWELLAMLRKHKIYVRYFNKPRIDNYLRISIGTRQEMEVLISCLESYLTAKERV